METTSIILAGTGVIQSLLLLLVLPTTEESMNEAVTREYEGYMKLKSGSIRNERTKGLIQFIADDKFGEDVFNNSENWNYLALLKKLKETFVKFYFKNISKINELKMDLEVVADIDNMIAEYVIRLMRLRLVIQPEVQISKNVHPRTNIEYLAIKAYWLDANGKKVRKFTKSIGRAENYPKGIKDKKALTDGLKLVQPVLFESYKESYPK